MSQNKKYYWLKLKEDFFERDEIKIIESQKNGKDYINFYFKLLLKSLKSNGLFVFDYLNAEYVKNIIIASDSKIIDGITFNISKTIENNTVIKSIDFTDKGQDFHFEERVKLFDKNYFESLASECNLTILNTFGNYQLQEFDVNSSPRFRLRRKRYEYYDIDG